MVHPCSADEFFEGVWEQRPLHVRRPNNPGRFGGLFSKGDAERLLRSDPGLRYGYNIDVTNYDEKAGRVTLNTNETSSKAAEGGAAGAAETSGEAGPSAPGQDVRDQHACADPAVVWGRYEQGCSVRVLHPQRWCDELWRLLARLEGYLQSNVGANAYLTPPGSQGTEMHASI